MIIYKQNIENGIPIYEIITKTFKTITVKFDETFSKNDIYKLLSLSFQKGTFLANINAILLGWAFESLMTF